MFRRRGVTAHIVRTMDEAIRMLPQVLALDHRTVRQRFEQRFSAASMAKDYVHVYARCSSGRRSRSARLSCRGSSLISGTSEQAKFFDLSKSDTLLFVPAS